MTKSFLNPEGHQNIINGSNVTAILLKGWIWPFGEASAGGGCASAACTAGVLRTGNPRYLGKKSRILVYSQK